MKKDFKMLKISPNVEEEQYIIDTSHDIIDPEEAVNVTLYLKNDLYESKYELSDSKKGDE